MDRVTPYHRFAAGLALGIALATGGYAQGPSATPPAEEGMASWYGPSFHGQLAASGEIYDSEQLTAAHRTLPFGTMVRVRRLDSAESIVVRINDRGPYVESRVIDLSYAAARRLGMTDPGLVAVALEVVGPPVPETPRFFAVQAGAFRDPDNARRTRAVMEEKFGAATVQRSGIYWRVLVGYVPSHAEAETLAGEVRKTFQSAFVVPLAR